MGISFENDSKVFVFDFENDPTDILRLTGNIYQVEAFGKCFYYGYEFTDNIDGHTRSELIKYIKFSPNLHKNPDISQLIQKAINGLNDCINLYDYNLVIMPESSSFVNQYMLRYIYRFSQPMMRSMELVKNLPANIDFDMDGYEQHYLNAKLENGYPRYTEAQKQEVKDTIGEMMQLIKHKDYFTIAKDVKKSRMRPYITNFLRFKSEADKTLCEKITQQNVLLIDDITTSGSTLNEVLRSLRVINEDNTITVFSLIRRKDLMADVM